MKPILSPIIITSGLGVAFFTLISISWIYYRNAIQLIDNTNQHINSQTELSLLQEISLDGTNTEIELKSYILTKNELHWQQYKIYSANIEQKIQKIQQLILPKSDEMQELDQLKKLINQRKKLHQKIKNFKIKNKLDVATQLALITQGNALSNQILSLITNLETQNQKKLQTYNQQSHKKFILIVIAGDIITLVTFAIVYYFLYRYIKEQQENANFLLKIKYKLEVLVEQKTVELQQIFTHLKQELNVRIKIEQKLKVSEKNQKAILNNILDIAWLKDSEGRFIAVNEAFTKATNLNIEDIIDKTDLDLWPLELAQKYRQQDIEAILSGKSKFIEEMLTNKSGNIMWLETVKTPIYNEEGEPIGITGIARDITTRKQAEKERIQLIKTLGLIANNLREAERRWRFLLENVQLAVVILDNNYHIQYVNPFLLKLIGYSQEELLGKDWYKILVPLDQESLTIENSKNWKNSQYTKSSSTSNTYSYCPLTSFLIPSPAGLYCDKSLASSASYIPSVLITKSGEKKVIAWKNTFLKNSRGDVISTMSIGEDITERQILERIKDEFISIVSHEIRTPLTAIYATLGMLSNGVLNPEGEKGKRALKIAARNTERLVKLVNDILDLERLQSGNLTLIKQASNTADLLEKSAELMQIIAKEAQINISFSSPNIQVYADPERIIQVLTNLISNAIKFSPAGATIWLSAELQQQKENNQNPSLYSVSLPLSHYSPPHRPAVLFKIKDQGRGIAPEKMETIFDRFHQIDASDTRQKGGTGLGLAICRSIVQQHGGQIWVESNLNEGSTFYFTLPVILV